MTVLFPLRRLAHLIAPVLGSGLALLASPASASEGGATVYLLGSGAPAAAVLPPFEGVYLDNTFYFYDGHAGGDVSIPLGGNVAAGLDAFIAAEFSTFLWVPSTNFLGGTVAVGGVIPIASPIVDAQAVITGPRGGQRTVSRHDGTLTYGDPVITGSLGWKWDSLHMTVSGLVNVPIGDYREGELANIAFHRWAEDVSLAISWHDVKSGWDVSTKAGVTFNGTNHDTDYNSGNDFHLEAGVEKTFSPEFSAGVIGYYYNQISGDSGSGARLGPNEGEVGAVGVTAAFNTVMGRSPTTVRVRILKEFDATRRLEGTVAMLSLTLPLKMNLPPQPQ